MRSLIALALLLMVIVAPSLSADSRRVAELQWIERRHVELQDDFGERLRQFETRLRRDVNVVGEAERAIDGLESPQAYSGVETAIEHLAAAVKIAEEEPRMPEELIAALRDGERQARALRSNPTSPARDQLRHLLHHSVLDPANDITREDVAEASEITLRIRRSLAETEEKLDQIMKLRSRLVVRSIMPD